MPHRTGRRSPPFGVGEIRSGGECARHALLRRDRGDGAGASGSKVHRDAGVSRLAAGAARGKDAVPTRGTREVSVAVASGQLCLLQADHANGIAEDPSSASTLPYPSCRDTPCSSLAASLSEPRVASTS